MVSHHSARSVVSWPLSWLAQGTGIISHSQWSSSAVVKNRHANKSSSIMMYPYRVLAARHNLISRHSGMRFVGDFRRILACKATIARGLLYLIDWNDQMVCVPKKIRDVISRSPSNGVNGSSLTEEEETVPRSARQGPFEYEHGSCVKKGWHFFGLPVNRRLGIRFLLFPVAGPFFRRADAR
ncbi:hypothetical protein F4679DRAFT_340731 [Xylaria curta]|nr:hypothetical protein F4679DRAFT_340731 [Xylaria curta]